MLKTRKTFTCKICGTSFREKPNRPNICCSYKCVKEYQRQLVEEKEKKEKDEPIVIDYLNTDKHRLDTPVKCSCCGITYYPFKRKPKIKEHFCGLKCYRNYIKKYGTLTPLPEDTEDKIKIKCIQCGKIFTSHPYRKNCKYCSTECMAEHGRSIKKCPSCGKIFHSPIHLKRIYCSNECATKGYGKRKSLFSTQMEEFLAPLFKIEREKYIVTTEKNRYSADFLVGNNVLVECNGDYWHCNPNKYVGEYYHSKCRKTAKEIWEFDKIRKERLEKLGYVVLIVWEYDWMKHPKETKERLILEIQKNIKN